MKAVISGYGKMGHMIEGVLIKHGIEIAAITEDVKSIDPEIAKESVCIDFTTPDAFSANYEFLAHNFKAVVVGTTGWEKIKTEVVNCFYSANTPMIYSANFSIGVNAVFAAVDKVSEILRGYNYIPHIEEIHHTQKLDSPSGTAKVLAHIIKHEKASASSKSSIFGSNAGHHLHQRRRHCRQTYSKIQIRRGQNQDFPRSFQQRGIRRRSSSSCPDDGRP